MEQFLHPASSLLIGCHSKGSLLSALLVLFVYRLLVLGDMDAEVAFNNDEIRVRVNLRIVQFNCLWRVLVFK